MGEPDTTLGGPAAGLPETNTRLGGWLGGDPSAYREGLQELSRRYWKPVYLYVRRAWAKTNEDAKDLSQDFFLWLLESEALRAFDPRKGRFRHFLKLVLSRHLADREDARRAQKRGGGARFLSLEGALPDLSEVVPDPGAATPEEIFDRAWWIAVTNHAFEQVRDRNAGSTAFVLYEAYDLALDPPTYRELALRYGISENDVKRHLLAIRDEIRAEIRAELGRLDLDHQTDWDELFGR